MDVAQLISDFGFPIVSAVGLLYMIYFIWSFITLKIKSKLAETSTTLVALIDRLRMLDNDIIRLQQKLDTVIELRETENGEKETRKAEQSGTKEKKGRGQ
jgi:hypothetical protein